VQRSTAAAGLNQAAGLLQGYCWLQQLHPKAAQRRSAEQSDWNTGHTRTPEPRCHYFLVHLSGCLCMFLAATLGQLLASTCNPMLSAQVFLRLGNHAGKYLPFFFPSSLVYSFTIGNCVFFSTIHRCCSQWTSGTLAFILCSPTLISGLKRRCLCSKRRWYNRAWDPNPVCLEPMSGLVEAYGEGSKSGEPAWSPCCRGKNHSCLLIVLICSFTPRWCFVDWEIHSNPSFSQGSKKR